MITFTWDPEKDAINRKKHGVSFDDAKTAFHDENGLLIADPVHSDDEDRFILLGLSGKAALLVVCHCNRDSEHVIRIISARKATRKEGAQYEQRH